ncbi:hypothetical protein [Streptomyces sp. NPDC058683]|uniref:hypothetical protein n=1 Tax=Streptomyces sp. NPDC058683 TaxID=3346597 RepID=UPI003668DD69
MPALRLARRRHHRHGVDDAGHQRVAERQVPDRTGLVQNPAQRGEEHHLGEHPAEPAEQPVARCPVGRYLMVDTLSVPLELAQAALERYPEAVLPA